MNKIAVEVEVEVEVEVHNLASDEALTFYGAPPEMAVCFAYACESNRLSEFFNVTRTGGDITKIFPLKKGKITVSCGNYAALV